MSLLVVTWFALGLIFVGVPSLYFLYLRRVASRPWNVKIDKEFNPPITVIIPTHNEEKTIRFKLENLSKVNYDKGKIQVILADDASTDDTLNEATKFLNLHPELNTEIISETGRKGKSGVLNLALKHAKHDIVIMSDADAFWIPNIITNAIPYLADPTIGAVIGRQKVLNSDQSWITETEEAYLNLTFEVIRLGESKIHSTVIFHGLFAAYKRNVLAEFNRETDDSGTALDIVQKGVRAIFIPEATCFDVSPITWRTMVSTKMRRASQLVQIYARCLKLLVKSQLRLPKKIAMPQIFLYLFNPVIFVLLVATTLMLVASFLPYSLIGFPIFLAALLPSKTRELIVEVVQNNCILLSALLTLVLRKKFIFWDTLEEPRSLLTRDMLEKKDLL